MDENVVFDPAAKQGDQTNQAPEGDQNAAPEPAAPAGDTTVAAPTDPATEQPVDAQPDQAVDDQLEMVPEEAPPPPSGPLGFLAANWKKFLIGFVILIILIVVINLLIPKNKVTQQVTLTWWGLWEEGPAVQTLILDFKKTHPNIDVQYVKRDPQDYLDRLKTRIDSGSGPDIFRYHNSWVPQLGDKLLPLSVDVITPETFKATYYPVIQHDLMKNNGILGIPLDADSLQMFINPDLFAAAGVQVPSKWDDLVTAAKDLTTKDSTSGKITQSGAALGTFNNISHASDIVSLLFVQQGVAMDTFTAPAKNKADALRFYTSFATGDNSVWNGTLDNSLLAFSKGKLAIYFGYSWDVFAIQRLNSNLKFKVYPVPQLSGIKTTIASYWVEGVSSKSKNQKEAYEFMKYLAQKDTAEKFYTESAKTRAFGEPYARKDLRESLREDPLVFPFLNSLDDASSTIFSSDTHDGDTGMDTILNNYLGDAINGIVNDSESPDSSVETLNNGVNQTLEKYGVTQPQQ